MNSILSMANVASMTATYKAFIVVMLITCAVAIAGVLYVQPMSGPQYLAPSDHHHYRYMADHPIGTHHVAPFCWRIGVPLLVQATGLSATAGFQLVNTFSLLVAVGFLFASACRLKFSIVSSICIALLYLSSPWTTKMLFLSPWLSDGVFYAMMCVALWASITRKVWLLASLTICGVLVRETALLFPLLYLLTSPLVGVKLRMSIVPMVASFIAGLVVMLLVQWQIPAQNHSPGYIHSLPPQLLLYFNLQTTDPYAEALRMPVARHEVIASTVAWRLSHLNAQEVNALTVGAWGILATLLAVLGGFKDRRKLWMFAVFVGVVYGQAIGGTNSQRLLTAGLPVVVLLAGVIIESMVRRSHILRLDALMLGLFAMIIANIFYPAMHIPIWLEAAILAATCSLVYGFAFVNRAVVRYSGTSNNPSLITS